MILVSHHIESIKVKLLHSEGLPSSPRSPCLADSGACAYFLAKRRYSKCLSILAQIARSHSVFRTLLMLVTLPPLSRLLQSLGSSERSPLSLVQLL